MAKERAAVWLSGDCAMCAKHVKWFLRPSLDVIVLLLNKTTAPMGVVTLRACVCACVIDICFCLTLIMQNRLKDRTYGFSSVDEGSLRWMCLIPER